MAGAGFTYWQVCPLGPTGYGDSPYQSFSSFALNPYLIDISLCERAGWLTPADLQPYRATQAQRVDYGQTYSRFWPILDAAFAAWDGQGRPALPGFMSFEAFCAQHQHWLEAYAWFRALKQHFDQKPWWQWPLAYRSYAAARAAPLLAEGHSVHRAIALHQFSQYLAFYSWHQVRATAASLGLRILGDIPIFVALDSADVWEHPQLFQLHADSLQPLYVAGVPPDAYAPQGQLWGNPLYDWAQHGSQGYRWWIARIHHHLQLLDCLRLDHFLGFQACWAVPYGATDAAPGHWQPGPGMAFFKALRQSLQDAATGAPAALGPLIAENLGPIDLEPLLQATGLPGMAVLQFGFADGPRSLHWPCNLHRNQVVYASTHDSDTSLGWYQSASEPTRDHLRRYLRVSGQHVAWDLIRTAYAAPCALAVLTLQDLLGLGSQARFNTPGSALGHWSWRVGAGQLQGLWEQYTPALRELAGLCNRLP
jgi:4-alpha-glucanotransferase